jgi:hypothetical protein
MSNETLVKTKCIRIINPSNDEQALKDIRLIDEEFAPNDEIPKGDYIGFYAQDQLNAYVHIEPDGLTVQMRDYSVQEGIYHPGMYPPILASMLQYWIQEYIRKYGRRPIIYVTYGDHYNKYVQPAWMYGATRPLWWGRTWIQWNPIWGLRPLWWGRTWRPWGRGLFSQLLRRGRRGIRPLRRGIRRGLRRFGRNLVRPFLGNAGRRRSMIPWRRPTRRGRGRSTRRPRTRRSGRVRPRSGGRSRSGSGGRRRGSQIGSAISTPASLRELKTSLDYISVKSNAIKDEIRTIETRMTDEYMSKGIIRELKEKKDELRSLEAEQDGYNEAINFTKSTKHFLGWDGLIGADVKNKSTKCEEEEEGEGEDDPYEMFMPDDDDEYEIDDDENFDIFASETDEEFEIAILRILIRNKEECLLTTQFHIDKLLNTRKNVTDEKNIEIIDAHINGLQEEVIELSTDLNAIRRQLNDLEVGQTNTTNSIIGVKTGTLAKGDEVITSMEVEESTTFPSSECQFKRELNMNKGCEENDIDMNKENCRIFYILTRIREKKEFLRYLYSQFVAAKIVREDGKQMTKREFRKLEEEYKKNMKELYSLRDDFESEYDIESEYMQKENDDEDYCGLGLMGFEKMKEDDEKITLRLDCNE